MEKLTHQPYEDWLLEAAALTPQQAGSLQEHVQECRACRQLASSVRGMEIELRAVPLAAPAAGFTQRWQARQRAALAHRQRRQTLLMMIFCVGGAMLLFAILLVAILPLLGMPLSAVVLPLYELTRVFSVATTLGDAAATVFRVIFNVVPPSLWVAIFLAFGGLSVLWIVSLQQLTSVRRVVL